MSGGSGRAGLTIVGQVVGSYFGPIGAAVGGMIGSYIGGQLWPEQQEGPKLEGMQITSSAYGGPLQIVFGGYRVAGNIIWASAIREVARTEEAGKGGGIETTTYRYYVDLAIGICEGEIIGARKMYADQQLIYEMGDGSDVTTLRATMVGAARAARFYPGSETQLPDPTIESAMGVGNTPAYRGLSYVVLENFDLSSFGNRTPNFNFEVISQADTITGPRRIFGVDWGLEYEVADEVEDVRIISAQSELVAISAQSSRAWVSGLQGEAPVTTTKTNFEAWPYFGVDSSGPPLYLDQDSLLLFPPNQTAPEESQVAIYCRLGSANSSNPITDPGGIAYQRIGASGWDMNGNFGLFGADYTGQLSDGNNYIQAAAGCADRRHIITILQPADQASDPYYWVLWRWDGGSFSEVDRGTVAIGTTIRRFGGDVRTINTAAQIGDAAMLESSLRHIWNATNTNHVYFLSIDDDGVMTSTELNYDSPPALGVLVPVSVFADGGLCWAYRDGNLYGFTRLETIGDPTVTLAEVVSGLCQRARLQPADIDVTDLEPVAVRGYLVTPRMSARAAIEPLMTVYAFDGVESDSKIKFVRRAATPAVTIPADDLGAGVSEASERVETERAQESELPASIDVTYAAVGADYQLGTQSFRRLATDSVDKQSLRLAVALEDQQAADVAARMVYELWMARNTRRWATTIKYARYEPTDVVALAVDDATYLARVTGKRESGNLIQWEGVDVEAAAFSATNTASEIPGAAVILKPAGMSQWLSVDLPPLRADDYGSVGYYTAAAGFSTPWPGATIFNSTDGLTYSSVTTHSIPAVMGSALTALPGWGATEEGGEAYLGYVVDEASTVDVAMTSGVPESCTYDELIAGANRAVLGNELIGYRTVTHVSGNVYRLSGLLRGLQGTEYYASLNPATFDSTTVISDGYVFTVPRSFVDGHREGDRFALLDTATTRRVTLAESTLGATVYSKAVTAGGTLGSVGAHPTPISGMSMVPPSPYETAIHRDPTTDALVVNCTPRVHVGFEWVDGRDVLPDLSGGQHAVHVRVNASSAAERTFFFSAPPPYEIPLASLQQLVPDDPVLSVAVWVSGVPWQYPNSVAVIGAPWQQPQFWSKRNFVAYI